MGATSKEPPPSASLIRRTISGSRTPATSRAPARSRRSGRTIERPMITVRNRESASTSRTATPTAMAAVRADLCSAAARELICADRACSTEPICESISFDMEPYHVSTLVVSDCQRVAVCCSVVMAWVSSALASKTKEVDTLLFHRLRWAMLAVVSNEARLLCCSDEGRVERGQLVRAELADQQAVGEDRALLGCLFLHPGHEAEHPDGLAERRVTGALAGHVDERDQLLDDRGVFLHHDQGRQLGGGRRHAELVSGSPAR